MFVFLARRRYLELSKSCKAQTPLGEYAALLPLGGLIASFSCKNLEHLQLHLVSPYWVAKTHTDISWKIKIFHSHPWLTYCTRPWKQGKNYDMIFIAANYSMPYHEKKHGQTKNLNTFQVVLSKFNVICFTDLGIYSCFPNKFAKLVKLKHAF